jgi:NAD(P)-dependent dehydrogenase (short-subunit alcohol dehydrogenase family)
MDIKERVAVITGAGSGIGEAAAMELASRGVKAVAMVDIDHGVEELVPKTESRGTGHQSEMWPYVGDVTDSSFREAVFADIAERGEVPTICIPAAGITRDALSVKRDKSTGEMTVFPIEDFEAVVRTNLVAPVYWGLEMITAIATDRANRDLSRWEPEERIQGTIIFVGSVSAQGNKGQLAYAATKSGLEGAAATITKEAMFYGVRCGVIHPGFTDTAMVHKLNDEFIQKHIIPHTQLRRLIRPEEIADAICFMISNSAVSGQLWADAGWHPAA